MWIVGLPCERELRDGTVTDQTLRQRTRERAKLVVRRTLGRANLDIGRDPYVNRLRRSLDHAGIDTVIDIGANVGQFGQMVRHAGFAGRIVSVEPLDSAHSELAKRASGDPQWSTVHAAVGAEPGSTTINVAGNSYSSSLLTMTQRHVSADPKSATIGTQDVQVTTVAELVRDHAVAPERCLLKVDTQGYERQVLDGAGDLLDRFAAVQLELSFVELYEGQQLYDELVQDLSIHGLELWALETGISDDTGRLLQCDGLFMRKAT
jgi:FkbM family methyltransferase